MRMVAGGVTKVFFHMRDARHMLRGSHELRLSE
jgi:hypothetical protein